MYYLQTRYYDPVIGRFIGPDDASYLGANGDLASYNLYAYCSNNPVMGYDPSGSFSVAKFFVSLMSRLAVSFFYAIELDAGFGQGIGIEKGESELSAYRDYYIGMDDGDIITGTKVHFGVKRLVGLEVEIDHVSERNGKRVCKPVKSDFGLLDMILDPEAEKTFKISLRKFSIDSKLTLRVEVGDSFHRFLGGHASAAININDFLRHFIGYGY